MRIAIVGLLLVAQTAAAQSLPDAAGLLQRESTALDTFTTFSYAEDTITSATVAGTPVAQQMTTTVTGTATGQRRMESRMGATALTVTVSDGHEFLIYMPMLNQYMRVNDASAGAALGNAPLGLAGAVDMLQMASASARVLRSESVEFDGMDHDCWVIERRVDEISMGGMTMRNAVETTWIDKALGLSLRRTLSAQLKGGPLPSTANIEVQTVKRALVLNPPVDEAIFVMTPPLGAKEMNVSSIVGFARRGTAPDAAPRRPPAIAKPGISPQAFVPSLQPIVNVQPEWPEAARTRNVQGSVDVLLTIDAQGVVIDAEVLNGPAVLRAAAKANAQRLRFHPVIRDGKPVSAYTIHPVLFVDWNHPNLEPEVDLQGATVMAEKQMALERAWPRTPAQVLADDENDLEGRDPFARQAMLPTVAKAAVAAGAMGTAERYAYEMLEASGGHGVMDGSAIHDGHIVLGLSAFARGDVETAKQHLLDAGHTSGSPVLNSFGPDLSLAQKLLEAGARDTVLDYLRSCEKFWTMGQSRLQEWIAAIEAGRTPTLANTMAGPGL